MDTATVKPVATEEESGDMDNSESEIWIYQEEAVTVKPIAYKTAAVKPYTSSKSACQEGPKAERRAWPHHLQISQNLVQNRQYRDTVMCLPAHTEQRLSRL